MLRLSFLASVLVLAACGSSKNAAPPPATTTAAPPPSSAVPGSTGLYAGGNWGVVLVDGRATAVHLTNGAWRTDTSGRVEITVLGPRPGSLAPRRPQIAAGLRAPAPMVESGLWVDGQELVAKGGGTPTNGTIYGAPAKPLRAGKHVAVAYARTDTTGTARAWSFRTP
ncbi:MAG TPA: hypothetical protein VF094_04795 [Gaiellaceae bacterium]